MAEIVNLRRARKARARDAAVTQAAIRRAAYGRTKAEKLGDAAEEARRIALLDGAKRGDDHGTDVNDA